MMWKQSVWSSIISATISSRFLKAGGVLTLTGADAALKGTPGMNADNLCLKKKENKTTFNLNRRDYTHEIILH